MNRRDFILGGGIIGAITGLLQTVKETSIEPGNIIPCRNDHTPDPDYIEAPAYQMASPVKRTETLSLVPCVKCKQLFAIKEEKPRLAGIFAIGAKDKLKTLV